MTASSETIEKIIKNKLWMPGIGILWLTFATFEISTSYFSITIASKDQDTPVYLGILFFMVWIIMLCIPPKKPTKSRSINSEMVTISPATRGLATRIIGNIKHGGKGGWMLMEDAVKLKTEHHDLKSSEKSEKITGLQLDNTTLIGLTERAASPDDGKTLIRYIHADDKTTIV